MKNFPLMAEVARAGLIGLRGLRVVPIATILANFAGLRLVKALEAKIDTLEINKKPKQWRRFKNVLMLSVFQCRFLFMKKLA